MRQKNTRIEQHGRFFYAEFKVNSKHDVSIDDIDLKQAFESDQKIKIAGYMKECLVRIGDRKFFRFYVWMCLQ